MVGDDQPDAREGQAGRYGVAERLVVPEKPGNAGGGKGASVQDRRMTWPGTRGLGNLSTPKSVQKLQTALHAKAKAEAAYRFYALYDKISRADILAHAYAQCRSNKGAPGVDGQAVHNHFNKERHLYSRENFELNRAAALAEWREFSAA